MNLRDVAFAACLTLAIAASAHASTDPQADAAFAGLGAAWAHLNYEVPDKHQEGAEASRLAVRADALAKRYPKRAEPLVWQALIVLSEADARHDISSLALAKTARHLLEHAARLDPQALSDGTIYANLGSLYAQLPGFPLSFGDEGKARVYLEKAVAANPDGLDANYFYGEFLVRQEAYGQAAKVLERALAAPARPGLEIADRGRKAEAAELLTKVHHKLRDAGAGAHPAQAPHHKRR